ncbi:MAG TPA: alpha/beta fold hydrolase [Sphingomonas sp.]|nr:alpha/beta fold hydrolase [Sphingomonas sp.]
MFLDLVREQTRDDLPRRARILEGLRAYQAAPRTGRLPKMPVIARAGRAMLRHYGGEGPPAVFVPSLINPPAILDLSEHNSLLRWMAGQGVRPLLVDWGDPSDHAPAQGEDVFSHASLLLPLLDQLGESVHLIGYCLGGTMALAASMQARLLSLTLIAAPWHFAGFGEQARAEIGALWQAARPSAERLGLVPMEVLQTGFWRLDPARTVAKYEAFSQFEPDSEQARGFVALEDWANDGAPLTFAAGRELFEGMIGADVTGRGDWHGVDPKLVGVPTLEFVSLHDRIVPAPSSARLPNQKLLGLGHVGMIVGSRAREQLWEPLAAHLSQAQQS